MNILVIDKCKYDFLLEVYINHRLADSKVDLLLH